MKSRILCRAGALLLALSLACSLLTLPAAAELTGLTISANHPEIEPGEETILTLSGAPNNADIAWSSDNTQVLPVPANASGSTCTLTAGTVTKRTEVQITATVTTISSGGSGDGSGDSSGDGSGGGSGTARDSGSVSYTVTVTPPDPEISIALDQTSASLPIGESLTLNAAVTASDGADTRLNWDLSDRQKFRLSQSPYDTHTATITTSSSAKAGDRVTVYAVSQADPSVYAVCTIQVVAALPPQVSSIQITTTPTYDGRNYVDPGAGNELTLVAAVSPAGVAEEDGRVTWSSSDTSIARVDPNTGEVTGVSPGEATITATAGSKTDERKIEVSGLLLSYVKKSASGGKGETIRLSADSVVDIYQYRDISVVFEAYGNARNKTINWESSNNTVAQVLSGRVTAHYPGENVVITATAAGTNCQASFKVRVSEDVAQAINVDMGSEPSYSFSGLLSQLNSRSQDKAGDPLEYVYSLKVSTKNGVLYYKYTSPDAPGHGVGGTERYYYQSTGQGQMALRDVTFVPLPGFDGTAVVDYNAASISGTTFSGTIRIEAKATGDVSYATAVDRPVDFAAEHFSAVCLGRTGRAISYVTFGLPSSSRGTLYVNYSPSGQYSPRVDSNTRYYATSSPSIDSITFVPAEGFTGDVEIPYRCTDSSGASYSGTVAIRVYSANGQENGDVEYSTGRNQRKTLNASDFNDASQRATGRSLNYIRFTSLPSSSAGTLYLNYSSSSSTKVSTGQNYYRNSSPRISSITFVPARDYSGTVTIPFTGTDTNGSTFSADLVIHVDDGIGTVHYATPKNQSVDFASGDFNDASRRITGQTLSHIRFTSLPSSSAGVLYYNYSGSSSSRVSTGTDYRRSGSPSLSNITFVPASGYTGTVTIPFTGYDDSNVRFTGTVTIAVGGGSSRTISYSVPAGAFVRFNASDFNSACRSATGDALNYVRFELPASRYGTLYHQYNASSRTGNSVSASTGYYYSGNSRLLSDVGFAAASTDGTVTFAYTGYSTRGDSFSGDVEITISGSLSVSSVIRYSGSAAAPIPFRSLDFQNLCQAALGNPLSSVQFTSLPATGRLYQNYSGPARTGSGVSAATRYGVQELGQLSYVPKAEYQGTVIIPYTAYDTTGKSHSSTVELQLSNGYCSASFSDTASGWDWAKPSIEFLRQSGITNGYSNNTYRPGQSISRGEFTLMVCRAFQFSTGGSSGFPDVPAGSSYAGAVAAARELGIVQGNNGLFQPDRPITRQSAMTMICRAIEAAGQSLPAADTGLLSSYADGYQVSAFARPSVAALVQMGAVRGNSASRLNPGAAISRAEMAVILHRVLTR